MVRVGVIVEGDKCFRWSRNFDELSVRASSRLRTPIGDTIFETKVISAHTVQRSKRFSEASFRTSFVFSSGSGLGKRYFSEVRVRVGIWLENSKKSGFNDPRFGASSFLCMEIRRGKTFCTCTQLHAQTVLPKALYPNFKRTEIPLPNPDPNHTEDPYPNPNPTEIPLPKPNPGEMYLSSKP